MLAVVRMLADGFSLVFEDSVDDDVRPYFIQVFEAG